MVDNGQCCILLYIHVPKYRFYTEVIYLNYTLEWTYAMCVLGYIKVLNYKPHIKHF